MATRGTMSGYFVPATLQAATTLDVMATKILVLATCFGGYSPSWQPENTDTLRNDMELLNMDYKLPYILVKPVNAV